MLTTGRLILVTDHPCSSQTDQSLLLTIHAHHRPTNPCYWRSMLTTDRQNLVTGDPCSPHWRSMLTTDRPILATDDPCSSQTDQFFLLTIHLPLRPTISDCMLMRSRDSRRATRSTSVRYEDQHSYADLRAQQHSSPSTDLPTHKLEQSPSGDNHCPGPGTRYACVLFVYYKALRSAN